MIKVFFYYMPFHSLTCVATDLRIPQRPIATGLTQDKPTPRVVDTKSADVIYYDQYSGHCTAPVGVDFLESLYTNSNAL